MPGVQSKTALQTKTNARLLLAAMVKGQEMGLAIILEAWHAVNNFDANEEQQQMVHAMMEGAALGCAIIQAAWLGWSTWPCNHPSSLMARS
jgi:hypothetical protein